MKSIPVNEFVALEKQVREALLAGDHDTVAKVNQRLADINVSAYLGEDGEVYLTVFNPKDMLPIGDD